MCNANAYANASPMRVGIESANASPRIGNCLACPCVCNIVLCVNIADAMKCYFISKNGFKYIIIPLLAVGFEGVCGKKP